MSLQGRTFSESWHKVAKMKVGVIPSARLWKQYFRGELWYILYDPFNNRFFRFRPEAYLLISRLTPKFTIEEIWNQCLEYDPENAPGQEDVIKILAQLYSSNLLYFSSTPDSGKMFERYSRRKKEEIKSKLLSIMFLRIPLFDPDRFLKLFMPFFKLIISPFGLLIWLSTVGFALKQLFENFGIITEKVQGVIAPDNIFLLYTALIIIKVLHEFGHSAVCRRFGGEVHTMGVMFLVFTPLPYMDATSSWMFRQKSKRILVSSAGILIEIFLAAVACIIWSFAGDGIVKSLCYNIMFIASVSTVIVNANPLLSFDGHYILADWLDIPNLHDRSRKQIKYVVEKYLFGVVDSIPVSDSKKESALLFIFGILSQLYKMVIFGGIALFVADKFLVLGLILAGFCIISWVVVPVGKFLKYLFLSNELSKNRSRAIFISSICFSIIIFLIFWIPIPDSFDSPGVVLSDNTVPVILKESGVVLKQYKKMGDFVLKDELLFKLKNPDLEFDFNIAKEKLEEIKIMLNQAIHDNIADIQPLKKQFDSIKARVDDLNERLESLNVRAEISGFWYADNLKHFSGTFVKRGMPVGEIIDSTNFKFNAVILQSEAANLFYNDIKSVEVKLSGEADTVIKISNYKIIPFESKRLPSTALGWLGGGNVATSNHDTSGLQAKEPFFLILADLPKTDNIKFIQGRTGKIHIKLPSSSLYNQLFRVIKQVFQRRYKL